jgi:peptidoglycan hydrolase CwlO-like protein
MALPSISFKEFVKNPITAMLFMCLISIAFLYVDNKSTLEGQIKELQSEVIELKKEYKELNDKFISMLQKVNK